MSPHEFSVHRPKVDFARFFGRHGGATIAIMVFALLLVGVDLISPGPLSYFDISFLSSGGATSALAAIGQNLLINAYDKAFHELGIPIGATWSYHLSNFNLHPKARINIFGYYDGINATALDMARLGWLWCKRGRWMGKQIVPESWMREATRTAPEIIASCPKEQWKYGYGFWTNDHSQLWPDLPCDSFAASGAGGQHIWVCPSLDLVVVQSPGVSKDQAERVSELLRLIRSACT